MDSTKIEKLEKHKKEIKRKAYLNILLTFVASITIAVILKGPIARLLKFFTGETTTFALVTITFGLGLLIYITPLIHYRQELETRSDKKPAYYLERGLNKNPIVEVLESQGWDEVEVMSDKILLEAYSTFIHRLIGKKSTMEIEIVEKREDKIISVFSLNGKQIEKTRTTVKPEENGSIIHETSVSVKRYSPAHLELILFILPEMQDAVKEAAEEDLELLDENIEYGVSKFSLESE